MQPCAEVISIWRVSKDYIRKRLGMVGQGFISIVCDDEAIANLRAERVDRD